MNKEAEINKELINVLKEKIQLLEELKEISQDIINTQKEQLILSGVGCSCVNKKEKPKAPNNRIVNNTSPVADSKKA